MPTIRDAIDALNERKAAVVNSNPGTLIHQERSDDGEHMDAGGAFTEKQFRQILVGFNLDLEELVKEGEGVSSINKKTLVAMVAGGRSSSQAMTDVLMSTWFDGILIGIKLQELRDKEKE